MAITGTGAIARKDFMAFADVGVSPTLEWELIGDKVEEMNLEMNPNVETVTDITGNTTTTVDKYDVQTPVAPFRAKKESKLFAWLYGIIKDLKTLTDVEKTFLCVNIFDVTTGTPDVYAAWTQKGVVAVQSYGGGSSGLDIPFSVHWSGARTYGTVAITAGIPVFTAAA